MMMLSGFRSCKQPLSQSCQLETHKHLSPLPAAPPGPLLAVPGRCCRWAAAAAAWRQRRADLVAVPQLSGAFVSTQLSYSAAWQSCTPRQAVLAIVALRSASVGSGTAETQSIRVYAANCAPKCAPECPNSRWRARAAATIGRLHLTPHSRPCMHEQRCISACSHSAEPVNEVVAGLDSACESVAKRALLCLRWRGSRADNS